MHILSKSTFMRGSQCHKSLWMHKHQPSARDPLSPEQRAIFERGRRVGVLARELFPGGVDASPPNPFHYARAVALTSRLVAEGTEVVYEAAFLHQRVLAAMDILVRTKGGYKAFEVKSSTSITETYLLDAALQYWVITGSGLPLVDISIIHVNSAYRREGKLDLLRLFTGRSVLAEVLERRSLVSTRVAELTRVARARQMPAVEIGPHCANPYPCDFMGYCWRKVPEYSVFDIARLGEEAKFELYRRGFTNVKEVPGDWPLSERQRLQVDAERTGEGVIEVGAIEEFLSTIRYPLCFLDFETIQPAVPLFDRSRPYQQIPFQFSAHACENPGTALTHVEFLAEPGPDPRPAFLAALLAATERTVARGGTVLAYNQSFECGRLEELAEDFPEQANALQPLHASFVDLMDPFQRFDYYLPSMRGSYSLKSVLPALAPELSYDRLEIRDGGAAGRAFESLFDEVDPARKQRIRRELLSYCALDTLALVQILDVLLAAVGRPRNLDLTKGGKRGTFEA